MYNCLGHQSWREKAAALLRAHPEFNEAPELDATAKDFYCMSWCPSHPDVNPIVFDLFDELIDAFEANAFHVGMDEVFILGHCPRCKGTPNADLFAKAVNDYHGHLVDKHGSRCRCGATGCWTARSPATGVGGERERHRQARSTRSPKDIVMCDWHYEVMDQFPSVRYFQEKGFRVWPAGWNKEASIRRLIEVARQEAGPKMLGYLCTTWTGVDQIVAGLAGEPIDPAHERVAAIVAGVKLGAELAKG